MRSGSRILVALALVSSTLCLAEISSDQRFELKTDNGTVECWRAGINLMMKDNAFCPNHTPDMRRDKAFCISSARCYVDGYAASPKMFTVTCRAHWVNPVRPDSAVGAQEKASGGHLACPSLQDCADDKYPDLLSETEMVRKLSLPRLDRDEDVIRPSEKNPPAPPVADATTH